MTIEDLFHFRTGNLPALEKTDNGLIPLVYGTTENNGVVKFVSAENPDDTFQPPLITVSYLGTAFVQTVAFTTSVVDKSNIIVLEPKKPMKLKELYFYCYQINRHAIFGFHYGRRMNMARLRKLPVILFTNDYDRVIPEINIKKLIPVIQVKFDGNIVKSNELIDIEKLFKIANAKSRGYDIYDSGNVKFISNGLQNNGIVGFVSPYKDDRVFNMVGITISAFCEAIVQTPPFLPRGNGGSGLIVLIPMKNMTIEEMNFYASYINQYLSWKYHYGRMVTVQRIKKEKIPSLNR